MSSDALNELSVLTKFLGEKEINNDCNSDRGKIVDQDAIITMNNFTGTLFIRQPSSTDDCASEIDANDESYGVDDNQMTEAETHDWNDESNSLEKNITFKFNEELDQPFNNNLQQKRGKEMLCNSTLTEYSHDRKNGNRWPLIQAPNSLSSINGIDPDKICDLMASTANEASKSSFFCINDTDADNMSSSNQERAKELLNYSSTTEYSKDRKNANSRPLTQMPNLLSSIVEIDSDKVCNLTASAANEDSKSLCSFIDNTNADNMINSNELSNANSNNTTPYLAFENF